MRIPVSAGDRHLAGAGAMRARDQQVRRLREHAYTFARTVVPALGDYVVTQLHGQDADTLAQLKACLGVVEKTLLDFARGTEEVTAAGIDGAYNALVRACYERRLPLKPGSRGAFLFTELYSEITGVSEFLAADAQLVADERYRVRESKPPSLRPTL